VLSTLLVPHPAAAAPVELEVTLRAADLRLPAAATVTSGRARLPH